MILSSHIIIASAFSAPLINQPLSFLNSALIFILSFLSHFLIDMIPHWDYKAAFVERFKEHRKTGKPIDIKELKNLFFKVDLAKFLFDGILGIFLSFLILNFFGFPISLNFGKIFMFSFAVLGGILPDTLSLLYYFHKKYSEETFLRYFYGFHNAIHGKRVFRRQFFLGAISQILTIAVIVLLIKFINL